VEKEVQVYDEEAVDGGSHSDSGTRVRQYWTDHIRSKATAPVAQAAPHPSYKGRCVHKPTTSCWEPTLSNHCEQWEAVEYHRSGNVKYDPGAPAYGEQYDPRDMREYGPKEYCLYRRSTGIDTNERRNNKLEDL
jgi:hypothetical protein